MADDGYLIGYEDSSGNFVEVGRINNSAEDTTKPLEIKHANSGETMELGPNGFNTNSVTTTDIETGRSWADETPSRSLDTVFTNNTNSELHLSVRVGTTANGTTLGLFWAEDVEDSGQIRRDSTDSGNEFLIQTTVPVGSDYRLGTFGDTGDFSLDRWAEFK